MLRQTSLEAYKSINDLSKREREVYSIVCQLEPIHNQEISKVLKLPINCVTGRTRSLLLKDLVYEVITTISQYTGRKVIRWGSKV